MHNLLGVVLRYAGKRRPAKNRGIGRIDLGPEQVDPKYAAMRDIECPRCAQTMLAMVDKDQYHIKFEAYPVCYGIFSMPVNSNTPKNTLYWNASSR